MFSGIAESEKEFREMCEAKRFDLTDLEIERGRKKTKWGGSSLKASKQI